MPEVTFKDASSVSQLMPQIEQLLDSQDSMTGSKVTAKLAAAIAVLADEVVSLKSRLDEIEGEGDGRRTPGQPR